MNTKIFYAERTHPLMAGFLGKFKVFKDTIENRKKIENLNRIDRKEGNTPRYKIIEP